MVDRATRLPDAITIRQGPDKQEAHGDYPWAPKIFGLVAIDKAYGVSRKGTTQSSRTGADYQPCCLQSRCCTVASTESSGQDPVSQYSFERECLLRENVFLGRLEMHQLRQSTPYIDGQSRCRYWPKSMPELRMPPRWRKPMSPPVG